MPKICNGCGKRVSETLTVCPHCRKTSFSKTDTQSVPKTTTTGTPPRHRVVGPVFTSAGFTAWFLVCEADVVIAVRQTLWFALTSSMTIGASPNTAFAPAIGGLAGATLAALGIKDANAVANVLAHTPITELRSNPRNVQWPIRQIAEITLKRPYASNPELIFNDKSGHKVVYGVTQVFRFPMIVEQMMAAYPSLLRTKNFELPGIARAEG